MGFYVDNAAWDAPSEVVNCIVLSFLEMVWGNGGLESLV